MKLSHLDPDHLTVAAAVAEAVRLMHSTSAFVLTGREDELLSTLRRMLVSLTGSGAVAETVLQLLEVDSEQDFREVVGFALAFHDAEAVLETQR